MKLLLSILVVLVLAFAVEGQSLQSEGLASVDVKVFSAITSCFYDSANLCDLVNSSNNGGLVDCGVLSNVSLNNCTVDANSSFFVTVGNESYNFTSDSDNSSVVNGSVFFSSDLFDNFSVSVICPDTINLSEVMTCPVLDYSQVKCVEECPVNTCAEIPACPACNPVCDRDNTWFYVIFGFLVVGLGVVIYMLVWGGGYE